MGSEEGFEKSEGLGVLEDCERGGSSTLGSPIFRKLSTAVDMVAVNRERGRQNVGGRRGIGDTVGRRWIPDGAAVPLRGRWWVVEPDGGCRHRRQN